MGYPDLKVGNGWSVLWLGQEMEDFVQEARALRGVEEELGVGGTFEDDELLRLLGFFVVVGDAGQAGAVSAGVVSGEDEELATGEFFRSVSALGGEDDDAVEGAGWGLGVGVADCVSTEAAADGGDGLRANAVEIDDGGEDVFSVVGI